MVRAELIFIPAPGVGHLLSTVEVAKLLVSRDSRLSISILIMKLPMDTGINAFIQSLEKDTTDGIVFRELPALDEIVISALMPKPGISFLPSFVESQRTNVRDAVAAILNGSESSRLAGFVIDMFCTPMVDVADEFGVPSYVFFTSGAAFLGLMFYAQSLKDDDNHDICEYKDSEVELSIPSYFNPVPAKVLPTVMLSKEGSAVVTSIARMFRRTKAIISNTVLELEAHAIKSLADDGKIPRIYHVGPIISFKRGDDGSKSLNQNSEEAIISWLDKQPPSSVVFLCFGSMGSFEKDQVTEIACALELSGHRFLWSLRRPSKVKEKIEMPKEYENFDEVLPEGFLERTTEIGKVIGWAPQVAILSHPSVGGFVSHCGWNSTLESIWSGVPMATWPLSAEQQINAFELVKELGVAVEIKMDYRKEPFVDCEPTLVPAEVIESGIRCLMDGEGEKVREKMKEMKNNCRKATLEGGSSHISLGNFIDDIMDNIHE
uniref:Glycosyltransferase n=1 Tax=Centella asiatica TaxID=48106 RepID=A0A2I7M6F4_CENAS|nr:UDP-glucosyltransferase 71A31 [Centella asiatica]